MSDKNSHTPDAKEANKEEKDKAFKAKAVAFLTGVTGISILFGFGATLAAAKKKDPHSFDQGLTGQIGEAVSEAEARPRLVNGKIVHPRPIQYVEPGASLAVRALGWGTLYAVTGCSVLFYGIWTLMGVKDLKEFREKVGTWLPAIRRNNPPQGRTEFSGINDLLQYIIDVDKEKKRIKSTSTAQEDKPV